MGMRNVSDVIFSSAVTADGSAINVNQIVSASFQVYCAGADLAGTLKLQASNDCPKAGNLAPFTPTNWTDIPNASVTITAGSGGLITIANMCYYWVQVSYTKSGGTGTANCQMNGLGI